MKYDSSVNTPEKKLFEKWKKYVCRSYLKNAVWLSMLAAFFIVMFNALLIQECSFVEKAILAAFEIFFLLIVFYQFRLVFIFKRKTLGSFQYGYVGEKARFRKAEVFKKKENRAFYLVVKLGNTCCEIKSDEHTYRHVDQGDRVMVFQCADDQVKRVISLE